MFNPPFPLFSHTELGLVWFLMYRQETLHNDDDCMTEARVKQVHED